MIALAALLASLYFLIVGAVPLVKATATGVWSGKSLGMRVVRAEEPERFNRLCRKQLLSLILPALAFVVALFFVAPAWMAAVQQVPRS